MAGPQTRLARAAATVIVAGATAMMTLGSPSAASAAAPDAPQHQTGKARVIGTDSPRAIKDRYIVVMDKTTTATQRGNAISQARSNGGKVHFTYSSALEGFAATLPARAVERLRENAHVSFIEADTRVSTDTTQSPATWGLDRIDQRNLPLNNAYTYTPTGAGVNAYIIDTGIRRTHTQFGGRAFSGYTAINDGRGSDDCHGHGTHVAGTVGGSTYGVAKGVRLYAVRVLDCTGNGTDSGVIAGIDWVTANKVRPAVANMSLGGGASTALDNAVTNSINSGVTYAVAAGNDGLNACSYSPARAAAAITVGSTTSTDARSSFSNYGTCLDVFAPGSSITSSWNTSDTATNTISGTSMATPARGRCGSSLPAGQHRCFGSDRAGRDRQHLDGQRRHQPRHGLAQPAALLAADHRGRHAAADRLRDDVHRIALRHRRLRHPAGRDVLPVDRLRNAQGLPDRAVRCGLRPLPLQVERVGLVDRRAVGVLDVHRDDHLLGNRGLLLLGGLLLQRFRELHPDGVAAVR